MKKHLFGVIGETSCGKDTLVRLMKERYGYTDVCSMTDRPIRADETQNVQHKFITKEHMDHVLDCEEILAYTKTGDVRYCATVENLDGAVFYIINPDGVRYFKENLSEYSDIVFHPICIYVPLDERLRRASYRSDFETNFEARVEAETEDFENFYASGDYDLFLENNVLEDTYTKFASYVSGVLSMECSDDEIATYLVTRDGSELFSTDSYSTALEHISNTVLGHNCKKVSNNFVQHDLVGIMQVIVYENEKLFKSIFTVQKIFSEDI